MDRPYGDARLGEGGPARRRPWYKPADAFHVLAALIAVAPRGKLLANAALIATAIVETGVLGADTVKVLLETLAVGQSALADVS